MTVDLLDVGLLFWTCLLARLVNAKVQWPDAGVN